jgi:hypothetical protein
MKWIVIGSVGGCFENGNNETLLENSWLDSDSVIVRRILLHDNEF